LDGFFWLPEVVSLTDRGRIVANIGARAPLLSHKQRLALSDAPSIASLSASRRSRKNSKPSLRVTGHRDTLRFIVNLLPIDLAFLVFESISFISNRGEISGKGTYYPVNRSYFPRKRARVLSCGARRVIVGACNANNFLVLRIQRFHAPTIWGGITDGREKHRRRCQPKTEPIHLANLLPSTFRSFGDHAS
jgi:hypothetical protein